MSDEEGKDISPESAPEEGRESWPQEEAPIVPEEPEDRIAKRLEETADTVTQELRDLNDELVPRAADEPAESPVPEIPAGEMPAPAEPSAPEIPVRETSAPAYDLPPLSAAPPITGQQPPKANAPFTREGSDDDRLMAALAWLSMVILQLPIVSVIQLLSTTTKDRPFQRHHAVTSLLFYAVGVVYEIMATVVFTILVAVTAGCGAICLWPLFFVPHALALFYAFQAYNGKRIVLPFLTDFARQQGWM